MRTILLSLLLCFAAHAAPAPKYRPLELRPDALVGKWFINWRGCDFAAEFRANGTCSTGGNWSGTYKVFKSSRGEILLAVQETSEDNICSWTAVVERSYKMSKALSLKVGVTTHSSVFNTELTSFTHQPFEAHLKPR
jgi:hypothetical protein